ncbi:MAG: hypothetical protein PUC94_04170 [Bacteroidales bacterium]|nr:hypothetical protein [Bacteroidales bacterium]
MEIVIENIPNLNAPAPAPEDTVAAEALVTNIDRLADESANEAAPAVPAATVPATALAANEAAEANPEPAAATAEAVPVATTEATPEAATYMPLASADEDGASKPIFLSRIRPGFWDLPEIAFD